MMEGMEIRQGVLLRCTLRETEAAVPEGVHTIGPNAFKGCVSLERVYLPGSLREIGASAFKGCRRLQSVNIPGGLERVGEYAFYRCHALREIGLPAGVRELGDCTFLYCDSLERAAIPGVLRLGRQVFLNDLSLRELTVAADLSAGQVRDVFTGCGQLTRFRFPDGSLYELDSPVQALLSGFHGPELVRIIAEDIYRSMELQNGVMLRFRTNLPRADIPEGIVEIGRSCFFDKRGITFVRLPQSLRAIRSCAFRNCISLERLELGSVNVRIDSDAFQNCSALREIILPDGQVCALHGLVPPGADTPLVVREIHAQLLSDFVLSGGILLQYLGREARPVVPEGVRVIGRRAFAGNDAIDRVILPDTVEEIQKEAFADCPALQAVPLPGSVRRLGEAVFAGCGKLIRCAIPEGVSAIPPSAFRRCGTLREAALPGSVREIGELAFDGCCKLPGIVLPAGLVKIGDMAFYKCGALRRIEIPDSVEDIGNNAFAKCSLVSVKLEHSPKKLGKNCFAWCEKLDLKNLPEKAERIPEAVYDGQDYAGIVRLPEGIRRIGANAFYNNQKITGIIFPHSLEEIGTRAFQRCTNLERIELQSAVRTGPSAFENCVRLKSLSAPQALQIGKRAFSGCLALRKADLAEGTRLDSLAFEDCARLECLTLPENSDMECDSFSGCTALRTVRTGGKAWVLSGWDALFDTSLPEQVRAVWISAQQCFSYQYRTRTLTAYHGCCPVIRIPDGVREIGPEVFRDHLMLEELYIPDSVTAVGERAFHGTPWLDRLKAAAPLPLIHGILPEAAFCRGVVTIPVEVRRIAGWAFTNQYGLEGVIFESSETVCEDFAFRNCINLRFVTLPDGTTYRLDCLEDRDAPDLPPLVRRIFQDCMNCFKVDGQGTLIECTGNIPRLTVPKGVTAIGPGVFANSNLLEEIILTPEVREIHGESFAQCRWLEQVRGGSGVERIGERAFINCTNLRRVEFGQCLRELDKRAFENCVSLEGITIPEGVREIPERAFFRCHSLHRAVLPAGISVKDDSFIGCPLQGERS
ncbi:MAG: leucine-rich repeat domain-containing protein [Oscillospiraceae bacterium]|nr:leucine-rich repeat domain-containing protein [Oscillospiraceae bacterium]